MHYGRLIGVVVALSLVTTGVAGVGLFGPASAQPRAATPIDSCRTITDSGQYALTSNITNSNRTVCIQILSSDVSFDGRGHTIKSGPQTTESVGIKANNSLTGLSNVTVRNVSATGWTAGVFYQGIKNGSLANVNASANRRHGVLLRTAPDTTLRNVTATHNGRWSLYATGNTTDVTAQTFETRSATVSFTGNDTALDGVNPPSSGIGNRSAIGQYVRAVGTGPNASLRLTVDYPQRAVSNRSVTESTLRMWRYDNGWRNLPGVNFVNVDRNRVVADVAHLQNGSVFAPAGAVETPTPTATPTATTKATNANATNATGGNATAPTSSSNGPGFGVGLALVALLAAALLARRR